MAEFKELGAYSWYTDDDINLFKEGKVRWVIDGTWNQGDFSVALGDNLALDPCSASLSNVVQTGMIYLNFNTAGATAAAAMDFLIYLMTTDAQVGICAAGESIIPAIEEIRGG